MTRGYGTGPSRKAPAEPRRETRQAPRPAPRKPAPRRSAPRRDPFDMAPPPRRPAPTRRRRTTRRVSRPPMRELSRVVPLLSAPNFKRTNIKLVKGESLYFEGIVTVQGDFLIDSVEGMLYVTNMRLILDAPGHSFNVNIAEVDDVEKTTFGVRIDINTQSYRLLTPAGVKIMNIIDDVLDSYDLEEEDLEDKYIKETPKTETVVKEVIKTVEKEPEKDPYEELKKLKELLDMDVISQDEFDRKKKELLGL